jgi:sulfonate transport system permease protein
MKISLSSVSRFYSTCAIVALWQLGSSTGVIPEHVLAGPVKIAETFFSLLASGELMRDLGVSLVRAFIGLGLALVLGTSLALFSGLSLWGEKIVDAPIQMARAMPFLGLVPLFILWFGIGETPKIALVTLGAVFPIYINLFAGIRGVDRKLIEAGTAFGLSPREQIIHVILPGALPSFLVGLRYAIAFAWLSLVVAEQVNAESGIGYLVMQAREYLRTDTMVVGLMVYALLGYASHYFVKLVEGRALAWRPSILR